MEDLRQKVIDIFNHSHCIAHDIKHVERVAALAKHIAINEGYDAVEAEIAALLHDIGRTVQKEEKGHGPAGVPLASQLLTEFTNYDDQTRSRILTAVEQHSQLNTVGELTHIVQDADMLDGLGAIGIMRAYTSSAHLPDYDPSNIMPTIGQRGTNSHDQMAFQMEWLGFIHTDTGKRIATERHDFMTKFLSKFSDEVKALDYK